VPIDPVLEHADLNPLPHYHNLAANQCNSRAFDATSHAASANDRTTIPFRVRKPLSGQHQGTCRPPPHRSAVEIRMQRREVIFGGRVQGVGFRATSKQIASTLPVSGWVRNEPDGTVRMEVQGAEAAIQDLLERVAERMPGKITRIESRAIHSIDDETGFRIIR
jgi:acylphosphatase